MINIPGTGPGSHPLTPEQAIIYLESKPKYLAMRKKLIPYVFDAEGFCKCFNRLKEQLNINKDNSEIKSLNAQIERLKQKKPLSIDEKNRSKSLQKQKDSIYYATVNKSFQLSTEHAINIKDAFYPLVGSLLNMFKVKEEKKSVQKTTEKAVDTVIDSEEVKEIKYIRILLRSAIGERHYKEFVADFFKEIKEYDEPVMENVVDVVSRLMKTYQVHDTENNLTQLIDYLQRMRSLRSKKSQKETNK